MYEVTKLMSKKHVEMLIKLLPSPKQRKMGRPRAKKNSLINGILQVLVNGVAWKKMASCGCSYASCFRYFKQLQRRGKLKIIYQKLAEDKTDLKIGSIDTTVIPSFEFKSMTGWNTKHHVSGTKVSLYTDMRGLPADCSFGKGSTNDKDFILHHISYTNGSGRRVLNLDMGYMSLSLRRELRNVGIRVNMKAREQDFKRKRGPKFKFDEKIYRLRFFIERTNGWIKNFKRLRLRREYLIANFKAFVYLALIIILIRS